MLKLTARPKGPSDAEKAQRRLADALPILVMISDADGAVQFFNRRWHEFTGQPSRRGRDRAELAPYMHPDDAAEVQAHWGAAVQRGDRVITMRYRLRHRASGPIPLVHRAGRRRRRRGRRIAQWIGAAVDVDDEVTARTRDGTAAHHADRGCGNLPARVAPAALPHIEGLRFDAQYRASTHALLVGGDWYDVFALPGRRVAVSIGDIAGHGLRAAVVMNKVRQSARAVALWEARTGVPDPVAVLDAMEQTLHAEDSELMATAIFGVIDLDARTLHTRMPDTRRR